MLSSIPVCGQYLKAINYLVNGAPGGFSWEELYWTSSRQLGEGLDGWGCGDEGWLIQTFRHHSCKNSLAHTLHYLNALKALHPQTRFYI